MNTLHLFDRWMKKMAEQLSTPPTVKFNAPGQRESISCQIEITQVFWQNAVVFLSAKRHWQQCSTEKKKPHCFLYIFHPAVILPAPMRASSFSLQAPSRQNARRPHQACSLTPQEKRRPVTLVDSHPVSSLAAHYTYRGLEWCQASASPRLLSTTVRLSFPPCPRSKWRV